jgi:hypothetical protein
MTYEHPAAKFREAPAVNIQCVVQTHLSFIDDEQIRIDFVGKDSLRESRSRTLQCFCTLALLRPGMCANSRVNLLPTNAYCVGLLSSQID